jgi:hypothetical protein
MKRNVIYIYIVKVLLATGLSKEASKTKISSKGAYGHMAL